MQVGGFASVVLIIINAVLPHSKTDPQRYLAVEIGFRGLEVLYLVAVLVLMGRKQGSSGNSSVSPSLHDADGAVHGRRVLV